MPDHHNIPIGGANWEFVPDEVWQAVSEFNSRVGYLAGEYMARGIFTCAQPSLAPSMVVSVNALMAAWAGPKDQALIAEALRDNWNQIVGALRELPPDALEHNPEALCDYATSVLPILLQLEGQDARRYVLVAKLLHWISNGRTPIVDKQAREKARELQDAWDGALNQATVILRDWQEDGTPTGSNDYVRWVLFYSHAINGLPLGLKEELVEHDWRTQNQVPEHWRFRNTLARIIDKYLWLRGGQPGAGHG